MGFLIGIFITNKCRCFINSIGGKNSGVSRQFDNGNKDTCHYGLTPVWDTWDTWDTLWECGCVDLGDSLRSFFHVFITPMSHTKLHVYCFHDLFSLRLEKFAKTMSSLPFSSFHSILKWFP